MTDADLAEDFRDNWGGFQTDRVLRDTSAPDAPCTLRLNVHAGSLRVKLMLQISELLEVAAIVHVYDPRPKILCDRILVSGRLRNTRRPLDVYRVRRQGIQDGPTLVGVCSQMLEETLVAIRADPLTWEKFFFHAQVVSESVFACSAGAMSLGRRPSRGRARRR